LHTTDDEGFALQVEESLRTSWQFQPSLHRYTTTTTIKPTSWVRCQLNWYQWTALQCTSPVK